MACATARSQGRQSALRRRRLRGVRGGRAKRKHSNPDFARRRRRPPRRDLTATTPTAITSAAATQPSGCARPERAVARRELEKIAPPRHCSQHVIALVADRPPDLVDALRTRLSSVTAMPATAAVRLIVLGDDAAHVVGQTARTSKHWGRSGTGTPFAARTSRGRSPPPRPFRQRDEPSPSKRPPAVAASIGRVLAMATAPAGVVSANDRQAFGRSGTPIAASAISSTMHRRATLFFACFATLAPAVGSAISPPRRFPPGRRSSGA